MFVQVIQGRVTDRDGLLRQLRTWQDELAPGATGWLGSTAGITEHGEALILARFESAVAAKANSARPEQGHWWATTAACFAEAPTFHDSEDVEELLGGGSDDAGFVQVMQGRALRRADLRSLEDEVEPILREVHTGLIGSVRSWYGNDEFTEAIYFTDEAAARAGEQAMGAQAELAPRLQEWQSTMTDVTYHDLTEPVLASP